jgi:hypothetical protein
VVVEALVTGPQLREVVISSWVKDNTSPDITSLDLNVIKLVVYLFFRIMVYR